MHSVFFLAETGFSANLVLLTKVEARTYIPGVVLSQEVQWCHCTITVGKWASISGAVDCSTAMRHTKEPLYREMFYDRMSEDCALRGIMQGREILMSH